MEAGTRDMDSPAISYRAFGISVCQKSKNPNMGFKKCDILNQSLSEAISLNYNNRGRYTGFADSFRSSKMNFRGQCGLGTPAPHTSNVLHCLIGMPQSVSTK